MERVRIGILSHAHAPANIYCRIQDYGDRPSTAAPRPADAAPLRLIRKGESQWTEFKLPIPKSQAERIAAVPRPFIDYVRGLIAETISAEAGRKSVEMVLGAYRSMREGRRISFPLTQAADFSGLGLSA